MRWAILGTLLIADDAGTEIPLPQGRVRAVAAVLLTRANQVVPADELAELVRDGAPPGGAARTVRVYVGRLRRALGPPMAARVITQAPGYLCQAGDDELDVLRFGKLCHDARLAACGHAWSAAAGLWAEALGLWRGEPLADIPSDLLRGRELPRLAQLHLQAVEDHIEAQLHLDGHEQLIPELREMTRQHPLREHLHAQLMRALARTGRRAEALDAYRYARRILVGQLGIEPGHELRDLHQRILAEDTELAANGHAAAPSRIPAAAVPRQLPAVPTDLVGRERELAVLTSLLERSRGLRPGTVLISAISGTAGVGKTALALHWAHQVAAQFPDGQLYADLRGFTPSGVPVEPAAVVRWFLEALAVPPARIPAEPDAQLALYRSRLAGTRILVVLDNARDENQVRPLLPSSVGCLALVTSRSQLAGLVALDGAIPLTLDLLTGREARALLSRRLGRERVVREEPAADDLIDACARLPLALNIAAARAALHQGAPLSDLARQLRDTHRRLDLLRVGEGAADTRAVFSWSYQTLSDPAARVFRLLGLHPGPDISIAAAASLAGADLGQNRRALEELTAAHLLIEHVQGRYSFHDLLRVFAVEQARTQDSEEERRQALHRVLDHYLHTSHAAAQLLYPGWPALDLAPPCQGSIPESLADRQQALAWLRAEHQVLLSVVGEAARVGFADHAWQIPWSLVTFLGQSGNWRERAVVGRIALTAAQGAGDPAAQAHAHRWLGDTFSMLGCYTDAHDHLQQALTLFEKIGARARQGNTHRAIGRTFELQKRFAEALTHAQQALVLSRAENDLSGQAMALNNLGWYSIFLGRCDKAQIFCQQALDLSRGAHLPHDEAAALDSIGFAHHQLGRYPDAITHYQQALRLQQSLGASYYQSQTLIHLGDAHQAAGEHAAARDAWRQALTILDEFDHPDADDVRSKLRNLDTPA